jgi:hypothetical protein
MKSLWKKLLVIFILVPIFAVTGYWIHSEKEWDKVKTSDSIEAYRIYLMENPSGRHCGEAKMRLSWKTAEMENTIEGYTRFIEEHEGPFSNQAKHRIETISFENAVNAGSIEALEDFLQVFPQSNHSDRAREKYRELLLQERHPAFRDVKKAAVVVSQQYEGGKDIDEPRFRSIAEGWLKCIGIDIVGEHDKYRDAVLKIEVSGKLQCAEYQTTVKFKPSNTETAIQNVSVNLYCPAGIIDITISLESIRTKTLLTEEIRYEKRGLPLLINPSTSVLSEALHWSKGSFTSTMPVLMKKAFGIHIISAGLRFIGTGENDDYWVRSGLISCLSRTRDTQAVPILIGLSKYRDNSDDPNKAEFSARLIAIWLLGEIRDKRAIGVLREALNHDDRIGGIPDGIPSHKTISEYVTEALNKVSGVPE